MSDEFKDFLEGMAMFSISIAFVALLVLFSRWIAGPL